MKSYSRITAIVFLSICSLYGCGKIEQADNDEVIFGTSAIEYSGIATKAEYSGNISDGYERIDWNAGDTIRIYCAEASEPTSKYHDYFIKDGTVGTSGRYSNAELDHDHQSVGLRWGTGVHNFYAIYPSPTIVASNTLSAGSASFTLPVTQNPLDIVKDGTSNNWTATPDLKHYLPMATVTKGVQSAIEAQPVFLSFVPMTTAIQFTLKNGYSNVADMNLVSVTLTSTTSDLTGTITANLADWTSDYPTCSLSGGAKSVTIPLGTLASPIVVKYGKTITFTVFLQSATDLTDLKLSVNTTTDNTNLNTITTSLCRIDGTSLNFDAFKKHFVSGIVVPDHISWIEIGSLSVASWRNAYIERDIDFNM